MLSQLKKSAKILIILLTIGFPFWGMAQKLEKPVIDKFTNDTTFYTTTVKIAANKTSMSSSVENIDAYFSKRKNSMFGHFNLAITVDDHHRFFISSGNQIMIKLADNSVLSFTVPNDTESKKVSYGSHLLRSMNWACWVADIGFGMTLENLQKISASAITAIRIQTNEQNYDFDIKAKDAEVINKMLQVILSAK